MVRAGLSPARLAQVGAELADEEGFEAVTATAVAGRVGVRAASIYAHVASSDELRVRICVLALGELADRGEQAIAGRSGRDAVAALGNVYRDYAAQHPGRYAATRQPFGAERGISPEVSAAVLSAGRRHSQMSRALLRGYALDEPELTHAVRLIGSVFHGFVDLELGGGFSQSAPASGDSWNRILEALDDLLSTWTTS